MSKKRFGLEEIIHISGRKYGLISQTGNYRYRRSDDHRVGDYFPSTIAERIVQKYIGKSFDDAFSHYCRLVPKYQQDNFLSLFRSYRQREAEYTLDSQNRIVDTKHYSRIKYKPRITLTSPNYTYIEVHKVTGHKKSDFTQVFNPKAKTYWERQKVSYFEYGVGHPSKPLNQRYRAKPEDFVCRTLTGFSYTFKSKHDREYKKCKRTHDFLWKRYYDEQFRIKEQKLQEALRKREEQLKREKEENKTKIIKHGFDPITSFRK